MTAADPWRAIMHHVLPLPLASGGTDTMGMPLTYRRFTVDEYHRMGEAGILTEDDRVELLDGRIVEMSPIGPRHAGCVKQLNRLLSLAAGPRGLLSVQDPLVLGSFEAPQPDLAVLRPRPDAYRSAHPQAEDVLLIVEVADSSGETDRRVKLRLYAVAGIPEVWLVDLPGDRIEVCREPRGDAYASRQILGRDATVTAVLLPELALPAAQILG